MYCDAPSLRASGSLSFPRAIATVLNPAFSRRIAHRGDRCPPSPENGDDIAGTGTTVPQGVKRRRRRTTARRVVPDQLLRHAGHRRRLSNQVVGIPPVRGNPRDAGRGLASEEVAASACVAIAAVAAVPAHPNTFAYRPAGPTSRSDRVVDQSQRPQDVRAHSELDPRLLAFLGPANRYGKPPRRPEP